MYIDLKALTRLAVILAAGLLPQLVLAQPAYAQSTAGHAVYAQGPFEYVSPRPNAQLVSAGTTLAVRQGNALAASSLTDALFTVTGSASGAHSGTVILADDDMTVIFTPNERFTPAETVSVDIQSGIRTTGGEVLSTMAYTFTVSSLMPATQVNQAARRQMSVVSAARDDDRAEIATSSQPLDNHIGTELSDMTSAATAIVEGYKTLPATYPHVSVTVMSEAADDGYLFMVNHQRRPPYPYLLILADNGDPIYYQALTPGLRHNDFKVLADGLLSYYDRPNNVFRIMDNTYRIVETIRAGNGYVIDNHGIQRNADGHILLQIYDNQPVDMSQVVAGGVPTATVTGAILQELDASRNVIFEWRSWDHFAIPDAADAIDFTAAAVDATHINSIAWDHTDGNIIISNRHMDEITKIDRRTADVIWRMGGKQNEFTFINEDRPFSHQHDARRIANGNLTLYDNGNTNDPQYSRAVEYQLDEVNKTATKVWEYRNQPADIYGFATGGNQRLPNGNSLIAWGGAGVGGVRPVFSEVKADGTKVAEMYFKSNESSYRVFRQPWEGRPFAPPTLVADTTQPETMLYYSWNGATHIASYRVYGGNTTAPNSLVDTQTKERFETMSMIAASTNPDPCYFYRVMPIDKDGNETAYSNLIFAGDPRCTQVVRLTPGMVVTRGLPSALDNPRVTTMLHAPADVVDSALVTETVTLLYVDQATPIQPAPTGLADTGIVFDLHAQVNGKILPSLAFTKPMTVVLTYTDAAVMGLDETKLNVYFWDTNRQLWDTTGLAVTARDDAQNQLTLTTMHLSHFALFAPIATDPNAAIELMTDGSFEAGSSTAAWTQSSTNLPSVICDGTCSYDGMPRTHSGTRWVFFGGGFSQAETAYVRQQVTVPDAQTVMTGTLSFWLQIPEGNNAQDTLTVSIDGQPVTTIAASDGNQYRSYTEVVIDVTEQVSATHTLSFDAVVQASSLTSFYLDDVSLTVQRKPEVIDTSRDIYLPIISHDPAESTQ